MRRGHTSRTHARTHAHTHKHTRTHTHKHAQTRTNTHAHTRTHTHKHTPPARTPTDAHTNTHRAIRYARALWTTIRSVTFHRANRQHLVELPLSHRQSSQQSQDQPTPKWQHPSDSLRSRDPKSRSTRPSHTPRRTSSTPSPFTLASPCPQRSSRTTTSTTPRPTVRGHAHRRRPTSNPPPARQNALPHNTAVCTRFADFPDAYAGSNTQIRDTINNLIEKSPQNWHTVRVLSESSRASVPRVASPTTTGSSNGPPLTFADRRPSLPPHRGHRRRMGRDSVSSRWVVAPMPRAPYARKRPLATSRFVPPRWIADSMSV